MYTCHVKMENGKTKNNNKIAIFLLHKHKFSHFFPPIFIAIDFPCEKVDNFDENNFDENLTFH